MLGKVCKVLKDVVCFGEGALRTRETRGAIARRSTEGASATRRETHRDDDVDDSDDDDEYAASDARAVDVCDESRTAETRSNDEDADGDARGFGVARFDDDGEYSEKRSSGDDDVDPRGGVRCVSGGYERGRPRGDRRGVG